jgi:hypothetical protein
MAQLVIAAAGAYIGSAAITGTILGMTGAQIGWMAGSLLGSALAPTQKSQGPRLGDLRVQGTEYGQPIPWVAGSPRISGQIVWASNRRETAKTEEVGKGGGAEYTTYTYDVDLLILLTENEIEGVSRIWSNGELVYGNGEIKENVWSDIRIYNGTSDQLPDPTYEAAVGASDAPAYRGRGYVLIQGLQLGGSGVIPNLTFEIGNSFDINLSQPNFTLPISQASISDSIAPAASLSTSPPAYTLSGGNLTIPRPDADSRYFSYTSSKFGVSPNIYVLEASFAISKIAGTSATTGDLCRIFGDYSNPAFLFCVKKVSGDIRLFVFVTNFSGSQVALLDVGPLDENVNNYKIVSSQINNGNFFTSMYFNDVLVYTSRYKAGGSVFWLGFAPAGNLGIDGMTVYGDVTQIKLNDSLTYWSFASGATSYDNPLYLDYSAKTGNYKGVVVSDTTRYFCANPSMAMTGKRYVEISTSVSNKFIAFGAISRTRLQSGNIYNDAVAGIRQAVVTKTGAYWDTALVDSGAKYNTMPSRVGILIDNDAQKVTCYFGSYSYTFSVSYSDMEPIFWADAGAEITVHRRRSQWQRKLSGVFPFTIDGSAGTSIVADLEETVVETLIRSGYSADEYEVDLSAEVKAMAVSNVSPTRATLEILQSAYFFEASKSDKIYVRPRSTTSVASIPYADLGTASDVNSDTEPLALNIGNELEVPAQLSISYNNVAEDYNIGTEHSDRLLTGQVSNQAIQMPLGLTPGQAKGIVDAMLWDSIAGLTKTTLALPLKYAYLEPGDVISVTNNDARQYRLRILTKRDTLPILTFECTLDDVNALTSAEITDENYISTTDVAVIAPTVWEAMDIPILRDADDDPGYYVAVAPDRAAAQDEWKGAVIVRSWDDVVYEQLVQTSDICVLGSCVDVLGDWTGGNVFDETNTLTVVMQGQLSSSTRADMLLDLSVNALLVGSEIVRFRTATLVSSTSDGEYEYRLSGLVRGQRGTEWAMTGHASDERCVLLNTKMRRIVTQTGQINVERYIKAITFGKLLSSTAGEQFTDTGVALKPFSPANARALADGSDLVLTWQRRTRLSYRYGGATPAVPLGESLELYRIKVYDGSTLVRTANVNTPTWTYDAADISADGFVSTDTITFEIMQLSETIGEGYEATIQGTAP